MNSSNTENTPGVQKHIGQDKINNFDAGFRGRVIPAGFDGSSQARKIWNGMFHKKPALIARCIGTSDVVKAVNFARDNSLE